MTKVTCPCGDAIEASFIGATTSSTEHATVTQFAWSHTDHYFYAVLRATDSGEATFTVTLQDPGHGPNRRQ